MDSKIIEPEQEQLKQKEEALREIDNFFDNFNNIDNIEKLQDEGIEGLFSLFSALLILPEKEFKLLASEILHEFEKLLNDPNEKLMLIQNLQANDMKAEDLIETYLKLVDEMKDIDILEDYKKDFIISLLYMISNAISATEGIPKRTINIGLQFCNNDAKVPCYARIGDAGMDLFAVEDIVINPGETKLIPTGLRVALPKGYELQVRPKSGRALKTKLRVANTPGTIDSGYHDEIKVIIENIEPAIKDIEYDFNDKKEIIIKSILHGASYSISKGEKFAQLVLSEVPTAVFNIMDNLFDDNNVVEDRGGGFGSTGVK